MKRMNIRSASRGRRPLLLPSLIVGREIIAVLNCGCGCGRGCGVCWLVLVRVGFEKSTWVMRCYV